MSLAIVCWCVVFSPNDNKKMATHYSKRSQSYSHSYFCGHDSCSDLGLSLSLSLSLSVYILFILYKDIHIDIYMFGNVDVFGLAIDAKTLILGNP